ncbi:MAG TPA: hotdog domain-containing protein [Jiangellaceae bacterium]
MTGPAPGLAADITHLVGVVDTATALGSGDVPVLATPRLLALAEAATVAAVAGALPADTTSVGTRVELEHLAASPVGTRVSVRAELVGVDGRLLRFEVVAEHPDGRVVAHGRISRVVVDRLGFLQRSGAPER